MPHATHVSKRNDPIGDTRSSNRNARSIAHVTKHMEPKCTNGGEKVVTRASKPSSLQRAKISTNTSSRGDTTLSYSDSLPLYSNTKIARKDPNCESDQPESNIEHLSKSMNTKMTKELVHKESRAVHSHVKASGADHNRLIDISVSIEHLPPSIISRMARDLFHEQTEAVYSHAASGVDTSHKSANDSPNIDNLPPSVICRLARDLFNEQIEALQSHGDDSAHLGLANIGKRYATDAQFLDAPTKKQRTQITTGRESNEDFRSTSSVFDFKTMTKETAQSQKHQLPVMQNSDEWFSFCHPTSVFATEKGRVNMSSSTAAKADDDFGRRMDNPISLSLQRAVNAGFILPVFHHRSNVSRRNLQNIGILPSRALKSGQVAPNRTDRGVATRSTSAKENVTRDHSTKDLDPRKLSKKDMRNNGWSRKNTMDAEEKKIKSWLSPDTKKQFEDLTEAKIFETLRIKHCGDEGLAWVEYSKHLPSNAKVLLKAGWSRDVMMNAYAEETISWLSPDTSMPFKDLKEAELFETLRKTHHGDEGQAWMEYSKNKPTQAPPKKIPKIKPKEKWWTREVQRNQDFLQILVVL